MNNTKMRCPKCKRFYDDLPDLIKKGGTTKKLGGLAFYAVCTCKEMFAVRLPTKQRNK